MFVLSAIQTLERYCYQLFNKRSININYGKRKLKNFCLSWCKWDLRKGFIETGRDLQHYDDFKKIWKLERDPYLLETSCAGIFAAGDVRAGAMNRVASAVGEGSMAISFVHRYLGEM